MWNKLLTNTDIKKFHQMTGDCADGCMTELKYITGDTANDDWVKFEPSKEALHVHLQKDCKIELVFKKISYLHYEPHMDADHIVYGISLFFYKNKIYFATFDDLEPDNINGKGGLVVIAQEGCWKYGV